MNSEGRREQNTSHFNLAAQWMGGGGRVGVGAARYNTEVEVCVCGRERETNRGGREIKHFAAGGLNINSECETLSQRKQKLVRSGKRRHFRPEQSLTAQPVKVTRSPRTSEPIRMILACGRSHNLNGNFLFIQLTGVEVLRFHWLRLKSNLNLFLSFKGRGVNSGGSFLNFLL